MSMLAEPRRKQTIINLRAKNNAWSNDANKFGQRMLEKMGWSAGKGLGAKENGIVEHVTAKYKNDDKGLGHEDKNDQWTKHEDDFNALLANLSSDKDKKQEAMHSGVSLEVKSKKSKARIHYHKFTRGKDLSRYSEKDLANIFGKKSFKEDTVGQTDKDDIKTKDNFFTERGSMEDYFKSKMTALKSKTKSTEINCDESNEPDFIFQGFSMLEDTENIIENEGSSLYNVSNKNNEIDGEEKPNKKNKKKKSKIIDLCNDEMEDDKPKVLRSSCDAPEDEEEHSHESESSVPLKKKGKHKLCHTEVENVCERVVTDKGRKKKKNKNTELLEDSEKKLADSSVPDDHVPKKKQKKNKVL